MSALKLYSFALSGHAHRARLFISLLGLPAEIIEVDLVNAEHKKPAFLQKNFFGQVPVLEDDNIIIADSNAILIYLAKTYDRTHTWYPDDLLSQVEIQRFLTIAAGPVAFGPAAARLVKVFGAKLDYELTVTRAHGILNTLNNYLSNKQWLVGTTPTIADVANYSYIAHAPEGGITLADYPNVQAWLKRIEQLPGFIAMQKTETA